MAASRARIQIGEAASSLPSNSGCGHGAWLSSRDLWLLETSLGLPGDGTSGQRMRRICDEARNVHLQRVALENGILAAVLDLESVLGVERPAEFPFSSVQDRFQEVWRAAATALGAFATLKVGGEEAAGWASTREAEAAMLRRAAEIGEALRDKDLADEDFEVFKASHERLRAMFRDLVAETETKRSAPPPLASKRHSKRCANCDIRFGVFGARKHCRNCGLCFCGPCAHTFLPLPHFGYDAPVRCCNKCLVLVQTPDCVNSVQIAESDTLQKARALLVQDSEMSLSQSKLNSSLTAHARLESTLDSKMSFPTFHQTLPSPPRTELSVSCSVEPSLADRLNEAKQRLREVPVVELVQHVPVGRVVDTGTDLCSQLKLARRRLRKTSVPEKRRPSFQQMTVGTDDMNAGVGEQSSPEGKELSFNTGATLQSRSSLSDQLQEGRSRQRSPDKKSNENALPRANFREALANAKLALRHVEWPEIKIFALQLPDVVDNEGDTENSLAIPMQSISLMKSWKEDDARMASRPVARRYTKEGHNKQSNCSSNGIGTPGGTSHRRSAPGPSDDLKIAETEKSSRDEGRQTEAAEHQFGALTSPSKTHVLSVRSRRGETPPRSGSLIDQIESGKLSLRGDGMTRRLRDSRMSHSTQKLDETSMADLKHSMAQRRKALNHSGGIHRHINSIDWTSDEDPL